MPIDKLVPSANATDVSGLLLVNNYLLIDETIANADGSSNSSHLNIQLTKVATWPLEDLTNTPSSVNSATFRVRAFINGRDDDFITYRFRLLIGAWDYSLEFTEADTAHTNKEIAVGTLFSEAEYNAATVEIEQTSYLKTKGDDGTSLLLDCFELEVDYEVDVNRDVVCTPEVLVLTKNDADVNRTRKVEHESAVNTYYFDASVSGPTDNDGAWTNDAAGFDGSTSTSATAEANGEYGIHDLQAVGHSGPSSGDAITQVRLRVYGGSWESDSQAIIAEVYDGVDLLGTVEIIGNYTSGAWSNYSTLIEPTGGWDWATTQALLVSVYGESLNLQWSHDLYRVELEITSSKENKLIVTSNPATIDTTTNRSVTGITEELALTEVPADINRTRSVLSVSEILRLTTNSAIVNKARDITSIPKALILATDNADVNRTRGVTGVTKAITITTLLAAIGAARGVVGSTKGLTLASIASEVNRGRNVGGIQNPVVETFYGDASISGPADAQDEWDNEANAFDGSTSTFSLGGYFAGTSPYYLIGQGHSGGISDRGIITQVRARAYTGVEFGDPFFCNVWFRHPDTWDTIDYTDNTEFPTLASPAWSPWKVLNAPVGGWTFYVFDRMHQYWGSNVLADKNAYKVELEVTYLPTNKARLRIGRNQASINRTRDVTCTTEILELTPNPAIVETTGDRDVTGFVEVLTLTSNPADVNRTRDVAGTVLSLVLTENQAVVDTSTNRIVNAITEVLDIAGIPADVNRTRDVSGTTVVLTLDELLADVNRQRQVAGATEVIILTENPANVTIDTNRNVQGVTEVLLITPNHATVSLGSVIRRVIIIG